MPPIRICFLMYHGSMQSGGQGVYLANVTRELARLGHAVHVVSGPPYPALDPAVTHHRLPTRSFQAMMLARSRFFHGVPAAAHFHPLNFYEFASTRFTLTSVLATFTLRALAELARIERGDGPFDIVHDNQSLGYGLLGIQRLLGRPVVANVHHPLDVDMRTGVAHVPSLREKVRRIAWYPWHMQRIVARRLDALISGSRASARLIERLWALPPDTMRTIHDGVDIDVFAPPAADETEPGTLLFVGNAEDYNKGVVYALRALARLPASLNAHLYLVGGPAGEQRIAPREIARVGIEGRATVVGRVSEAALAGWYRRAQVLVSPSLYEGFGLPAAEAMACGTPVIATDAGALPEVVADGETGIIVPAADVHALAAAMGALLADRERCRRMGGAGRERVLREFTWGRHARGLEALYEETRARRAPAPREGGALSASAS
ncbi:MAG TPA: glycosyltransferase family 4 protein [Dehalococcoidia bacterium]|nr:glycosyltransferase family 4 protein [Dehalococcoidia bacterium]